MIWKKPKNDFGKNPKMKFLLSLIFFIQTTSQFPQTDNTGGSSGKTGFFGVPFVSYAPETEWAFGGIGLFYFFTGKPYNDKARLSNILLAVQYTTKKQITASADYDLYFNSDKHRIYENGYSCLLTENGYDARIVLPVAFNGLELPYRFTIRASLPIDAKRKTVTVAG
jgi:hypothetical protein